MNVGLEGSEAVARLAAISLVLPIFNEAAGVEAVLREAHAALAARFDRFEILAVDDGSTDATPGILRSLAVELGGIRVLTQPGNRGYAAALIRGFSKARFDPIAYTDADGQFDLADLDRALPLLEPGVELVAGIRQHRADSALRRFASAGFNRLARMLLRIEARDIDCAFKLFRRSFFDRVQLSSSGFLVDSEIFARAQARGVQMRQLEVRHLPRRAGQSTVRPSAIFRSFRQLLALRRELEREQREAQGLAFENPSAPGAPATVAKNLAPRRSR